jgi:ribokinase
MNDFDFIAVGDIVTDAFIKLKEAEIETGADGRERLSMRFGDKIPYESVTVVPAVGNSPNAAVAASRLGLRSALVSNIGADDSGEEMLASLDKDKVATKFIAKHSDHKSNYHYVLWYQDDRTILVKHEDYSREWQDIGQPKWLYLSSLGENSLFYHQNIGEYLMAHSEVKLAFQPGTFQMKLGVEELKDIYARSEIFFCNKQEARQILQTDNQDIKVLLNGLAKLGPEMVVVTDGPAGAYLLTENEYWHMPIYPDVAPPVDRTGAGDAFSSTFTAMLALGKSVTEALRLAPINSMNVVQYVGAQAGLLTLPELEKFLAQAPVTYQPEKI